MRVELLVMLVLLWLVLLVLLRLLLLELLRLGLFVAPLPVGKYWLERRVVEVHLSPRGFDLGISCAVGWGCRRV